MATSYTLAELAALVDGQVRGDSSLKVSALNGIEYAGPGEITFILQAKQVEALTECGATACLVPEDVTEASLPVIAVARPELAAALIHNHLLEEPFTAKGVHPTAVVGEGCSIPQQVIIGPQACLGDRVQLGERVTIHPGVVIGDDVTIGDDTILHANVTVAGRCTIGSRVILHHGAVIGSDGFGFVTDARGFHIKKPQVGTVRIDDEVEIGANACVDRAAFGTTWIKAGARIDNLVMVAHNVVVGENSVLVSQVGIAGSTTLGRNVVLGGKVGVNGHVTLGDGVMAAAMSGVHNDQPDGAVIGGAPAFDAKKWARATAAYTRLPEVVKEVRRLKREVERLTGLLDTTESTEREEE